MTRKHITEAEVAAMFVPKAKAREVIMEVCEASGVKVAALMGRSQQRRHVWPRQVAYRALHRAGYSLSEIGRIMKRDHATIISGIRAADQRVGAWDDQEASA